jgi:biopolymer transport protein ExbD
MALGGFDDSNEAPMAQMNVIPLVDIMLVLLVIFIITAPVLTHAVKVNLPRASNTLNQERPETMTLTLDAQGRMYWNDQPISEAQLPERLRAAVARNPQLAVNIRADKTLTYEVLARVMASAQHNGVQRLGFITEPAR